MSPEPESNGAPPRNGNTTTETKKTSPSAKKPRIIPFRERKLSEYMNEEIGPDLLVEIELILLAMATGIHDAFTYTNYRAFAANQTGNTVMLAIGALAIGDHSVDLRNVGYSLGIFMLGALLLGQLGHYVGRTPRRRWLLFTNILQTCLVFVAAALRKWVDSGPASAQHPARFAVISLLSFVSAGQMAFARSVNIPEITTGVITSAYVDFLIDPKLLVKNNRPRNRRGVFVVAILVGAFIGASAYRNVGSAFPLLLSGIAKLIVCVLLFFNPGKKKPPAVPQQQGNV